MLDFLLCINNALDQEYVTGGFEQGRKSNYRDVKEDKSLEYGPVFGPRYFFGAGAYLLCKCLRKILINKIQTDVSST